MDQSWIIMRQEKHHRDFINSLNSLRWWINNSDQDDRKEADHINDSDSEMWNLSQNHLPMYSIKKFIQDKKHKPRKTEMMTKSNQ